MDYNDRQSWSFTIQPDYVNEDLFKSLVGATNFNDLNNAVTTAAKEEDNNMNDINDSTVTIHVDCDTKEAMENLKELSNTLEHISEQLEAMRNATVNYPHPNEVFTNNYNHCTFVYGKYGTAETYNKCEGLDRTTEMTVEDNENTCDCDCDNINDCDCTCDCNN